ncbi:MAG TPA: OmpA family protein, partial [Saprospiraceae bacterium]|nr:OmpA family protein [Saprospiraceae bacterium]
KDAMFEAGKTFEVKDIYYDYNKSNIRKDAAKVLDKLVDLLREFPEMEIELSSHTDSRGTDGYNQKLSQSRADSAVRYLESKGISSSRMRSAGYGERVLKNDCADGVNCNEAQHQENRRTEIKILKL